MKVVVYSQNKRGEKKMVAIFMKFEDYENSYSALEESLEEGCTLVEEEVHSLADEQMKVLGDYKPINEMDIMEKERLSNIYSEWVINESTDRVGEVKTLCMNMPDEILQDYVSEL